MAEKDITEKILLSYADVFADVVNALVFDGEQIVDIPERLKPHTVDVEINPYEIAYLTDEQLSYFYSDFKIVADYFVQMQRTRDYIPSHEKIQHVEAVLQLLSVLTEDNRFEETLNQPEESAKGGVNNMCEVLDRVEARGEARGEIKGTIKFCRDETDLKPVEITKKIMERFSLDKDSAEKYVEEIFGTQLV